MDKNGQIAIGDVNNYIKYFKDTDGRYRLKISAASLEFNASGDSGEESKDLETVIKDINDKVDGIAKTNKGIGSITNYYLATSESSGVTTETAGWTTKIQNVSSSKKYLWNYEVTKYTDDTIANTTEPCIIGMYSAVGATGNGIQKITEYYALSALKDSVPTVWSENVPNLTATNKYLWNYEKILYTNGGTELTKKRIIGVYGDTGKDGAKGEDGYSPTATVSKNGDTTTITIVDKTGTHTQTVKDGTNGTPGKDGINGKTTYFHVKYSNDGGKTFTSNSGETVGSYIGTCTNYTEADPTTVGSYVWAKIKGEKGDTGNNGKSIGSVINYYLATSASSGVSTSTSGWTTAVQNVTLEKKYLWNYEVVKYTDGTVASTTSPCIIGTYGDTGKTGATGKNALQVLKQWNGTYTTIGQEVNCPTDRFNRIPVTGDMFTNVDASSNLGTWQITKVADGQAYFKMVSYVSAKGATGATGNGIKNIKEHYAVSTSNTVTPTSWLDDVPVTNPVNKYLWNYETITYTNGTSVDSKKRVIGVYGDTGKDGKGIKSTAVTYQASTSGTVIPTGTWQTSIPTVSAGQYLWTRTVITYTDDSKSTSYSVGRMGTNGTNGTNGSAGRGIKSTAIAYQAGSSGTTAPTGTWHTTVPATSASSPYLWTRTIITYTDDTTSTSYAVGSTLEGVSVGGRNLARKTSNEYCTAFNSFNGSDNICPNLAMVSTAGLTVGDKVTVRLVYKYTNIVAVTGKTAAAWLQGAGNITEWKSGTFVSNQCIALSGSGEKVIKYSFTITSDMIKNQCWYVNIRHDGVKSGSVQWKEFKVEKGNIATDWTPAPEDGIASVDVEYYLSNSATALSGGSWSTTAPTWVNGKYMWSRTVTTDGAGNKTYSPNQNGVCIAGAKGETGNDGKNALQPKRNWSGTFTTIGETANVSTSSFNRTPVVGDVFTNLDGSSNTGTWEITKIENGNAFFKLLSYVSSKGATGATGATGKGVSSIVEQYYKSTSATALSGGSWSTTYPGWESGKYIWTRSVITYTDGNAITTNPICVSGDKGNDGINGTNLWINPLFESDKPQIGTRDTSIKAPNGSAVNLIDKRDNYNSSANFPVFPGHSYRITVHRKKKSGSVNLKAGIWYIAQTSGHSFDTYVDAYSTKNLSDGWQEAVYNITCPNGKSKGCVFLQLEKTSTTNTDAAWYVANIICTDITGLKGDKGDTGAKGATGAKGETGNTALAFKKNFTGTYTTVGDGSNAMLTSFNRTPVVGDIFTNIDGSSNTGTWEITKIENDRAYFKLLSYVNSKGEKGEKGNTGATGPKGDGLDVKDTRATNESPNWYIKNYPKTTVMEFKECKAIGLSNVGTYCNLQTIVIWSDSSGGYPRQTAKIEGTGKEYWRVGTSNTTWSSWIDPYGKSLEAAKTATNFMEFTSGTGLQIGDKTNGTWKGFRSRITSTAFEILNEAGAAVASYGRKLIQLGKDSVDAIIELCGGKGNIKYATPENNYIQHGLALDRGLVIESVDNIIIKPANKFFVNTELTDSTTDFVGRSSITPGSFQLNVWQSNKGSNIINASVGIEGNIEEGLNLEATGGKYDFLEAIRFNNISLLDWIYPVGSIYMSAKEGNPALLFGGTWVAWGAGRVPVGFNGSDGNFNSSEKTGGSKTINIQHNHGLSNARAAVGRADSSLSTMSYTSGGNPHNVYFDREFSYYGGISGGSKHATDTSLIYGNTNNGGSTAASVLQPYIVCYMWKRTA